MRQDGTISDKALWQTTLICLVVVLMVATEHKTYWSVMGRDDCLMWTFIWQKRMVCTGERMGDDLLTGFSVEKGRMTEQHFLTPTNCCSWPSRLRREQMWLCSLRSRSACCPTKGALVVVLLVFTTFLQSALSCDTGNLLQYSQC